MNTKPTQVIQRPLTHFTAVCEKGHKRNFDFIGDHSTMKSFKAPCPECPIDPENINQTFTIESVDLRVFQVKRDSQTNQKIEVAIEAAKSQ